jgi:hypothetical protein
MELKGSHTYNAPIDRVLAMFADPDAAAAKYEGMGHRHVQILECAREGPVLRLRSSRIVDVDVPSFARKVLKPTNTMLQTDEWREVPDGAWHGTFNVEVKGAPVRISGSTRLTPIDGSCRHEVTISVSVRVPLVGGRIATWVANNDVRRTLDSEAAFGDRWLAEHGS